MKTCEPWFVFRLVLLVAAASCTSCFHYSIPSRRSRLETTWKHKSQNLFVYPDDKSRKEGNPVETGKSSLDRRSFLWKSPIALLGISSGGSLLQLLGPTAAARAATPTNGKDTGGRLTDAILQSLVFDKVLGSGSYKTVYLVSATLPDGENFRYAMAVERLRNKRDVKNAVRGVQLPGLIQQNLSDAEKEFFETIVDWWFQSSNVADFEEGKPVFPQTTASTRSRKEPSKNFAGSRWMISLKPVYETDFKRFILKSPALYPIGQAAGNKNTYWTEPVLLAFVLEILHAGRLLHETGIVHRDIKPKNMMISSTKRPVIIDYGFAEVGSPLALEEAKKKTDICVVRPGQLKGEVDYVLSKDLTNYRGCERGDAYAMGKTLYEFLFGSAELQEQNKNDDEVISVEGAEMRNQQFWERLYKDDTGIKSRFPLSRDAADCLLQIIKGLCGGNPKDATRALSFAEAEDILSAFVSAQSSS